MMSFAVLLLCAVSGHTVGSTLKPLQELSMEDAVLSLIKQMSNLEEKILVLEKKDSVEEMQKIKDELLLEKKDSVEEMQKIKVELVLEIKSSEQRSVENKNEIEQRFIENKNEIASKLEQVLARTSEIEKSSKVAIDDVSNRLQVEKNKLLLMNNHLLAEVLELRKRDLDTFEKIANVESEVRDRVTRVESVEQGKKIQEEFLVEIKRVEKNYLEDKNEQSSKLEQVLHKISEIEKSSNVAIGDVSDRLQVEKTKLLLMNNNLSAEVLELQKRDLDTFEKIAKVEIELSRGRVRADLLQVRLNETANMTHSCLASQTQIQETMQKNIERLDLIEESNLSAKMGNVENLFKTLRQDLDYVSNRRDDTLELTVQNNTNDIGQLKQEISRVQTICRPPCENGGQCVKNVCNCTPFFTGDSCQQIVCSPPCENGGQCMRNNICKCTLSSYGDRCQIVCSPPCENGGQCMLNNICKCTLSFYGDRCQNGTECGVDFHNGGSNGGGNISSDLVWPWMAALYKNTEHVCDGSVIHRHFVLTTAWCVKEHLTARLSVKLGLSDLKKGTHLQEYRVQSTYVHPEFDRLKQLNLDYNIGLLEMDKPIPFSSFVRPICLPPPEILQDELFYKPRSTMKAVYLRHYLSSSQTASPSMLNLTILSRDECRRKIKETNRDKSYPSPDLSFCAGNSTTCPRNGSPLMQSLLAGDDARTWTQVGIMSGCSDKFIRSPRLDHLRVWVDSKIAASSKT